MEKKNKPLGNLPEQSIFDDVRAKEIDFGSVLLFQINDIRKYSNVGDLDRYANSVEELETMLIYYINEPSTWARNYKKEIKKATGEFKDKLKHPPKNLYYEKDKRGWWNSCKYNFIKKKHRALEEFIGKKNFLPRQRVGRA